MDLMDAEERYCRVPSKGDVDGSSGQGVTLLFGLNRMNGPMSKQEATVNSQNDLAMHSSRHSSTIH